jgi:hypothetical protein
VLDGSVQAAIDGEMRLLDAHVRSDEIGASGPLEPRGGHFGAQGRSPARGIIVTE